MKEYRRSMEGVMASAYINEPVYADTGCEVHNSCLSCPLPVCVHDLTNRRLLCSLISNPVDSQIEQEVRSSGLPTAQAVRVVAERRGVTSRTVYRAMHRSKTLRDWISSSRESEITDDGANRLH